MSKKDNRTGAGGYGQIRPDGHVFGYWNFNVSLDFFNLALLLHCKPPYSKSAPTFFCGLLIFYYH
jgi:hypothetical protein